MYGKYNQQNYTCITKPVIFYKESDIELSNLTHLTKGFVSLLIVIVVIFNFKDKTLIFIFASQLSICQKKYYMQFGHVWL